MILFMGEGSPPKWILNYLFIKQKVVCTTFFVVISVDYEFYIL